MPRPRLPSTVVIADRVWRVAVDDLTEHRVHGRTFTRRSLIEIDSGLEQQEAESTLLHEALHACLFLAGLRLGDDDEERIVSALEPMLYSMLRRNRAWWARL